MCTLKAGRFSPSCSDEAAPDVEPTPNSRRIAAQPDAAAVQVAGSSLRAHAACWEPLGATGVWVLPNPSGLNAHYQLPELTAAYAALQSRSGTGSSSASAASRSAHSSSSSKV